MGIQPTLSCKVTFPSDSNCHSFQTREVIVIPLIGLTYKYTYCSMKSSVNLAETVLTHSPGFC